MIDWEEFYNSFRKPGFVPGYEIQNRLGGGAFGEVYKARKSSIGKPYAIKFLKLDDQTAREAVERELDQVRHFAQIDHPNLVTIEDMGVVLGVPYLIMGYAGEDTLARRLKRERLSAERALAYFVQTARGVLALHDRSLVHFDLKPSNIFLKGEIARVGDYGLAKMMTDGRSTLSFGRGTPHYMAPEMLKNRADQRADVYSLGVILFEAVAGKLPYDADPAGGFVLREEDVPPVFPAEFPAALRPAVEQCVRLAPERRFQNVHELLEALGQTARQGDSIALTGSAPPRGAPSAESATADGETPPETPRARPGSGTPVSTPGGVSTARAAANELARGAREVALGVWEGIRNVRAHPAERAPPLTAPLPTPSGATAPEIPVSVTPLAEAVRANSASDWVTGLAAPSEHAVAVQAATHALSEPRASAAGAAAATIPVPPRAAGGIFGTLATTLALGVEILFAILAGPVRAALRGVGRAGRGLLSKSRTAIGATLRLALFLIGMAALGALLAGLAYSLLAGSGN